MTEEELEAIIEKARVDRAVVIDLCCKEITSLPESLGNLTSLTSLYLQDNQISKLPESIGNLCNLIDLYLTRNKLTSLPKSIGNLSKLNYLNLESNQLTALPESIGNLSSLGHLYLTSNQITTLPESIGELSSIKYLHLSNNQLTALPININNLSKIIFLDLNENSITNLSALGRLQKLTLVKFTNVFLSRRYWTKLSEWRSEWLLDEENAEIRQRLIQQIGYERICQELYAEELDSWREYTLVKIDDVERFYDEDTEEEISREPMLLLKMTCPSTGHIHILRVPPEMTSAEAAITWVNHGIHPDEFAVQT